ncbi:M15 family metallopeptidase [Halomonas beimenensis]|uniref:D-alanyl-D-alanine dipeptidase n=2 Tax=Halomonas beimenensis TaxID=475662 RepID=A0A291P2Q2_9GAMM|nr:M15 family metallopeptidase [Halomonas beimenensis]ATJ81145.1 D-alanyl-D-alanine dipeptidase [Halomonas beimenensis]
MPAPLPPIPHLPEPDWSAMARLPIRECHEPLVPVSLAPPPLGAYPAYSRLGVPGAVNECHVREGVYRRLLAVARALPEGLSLLVLDGWRPWRVQQHLFETLQEAIRERHPSLDEATLEARTREFVALPSRDPEAPSPHLTGGAVDVTLCDPDGLPLPMGTLFDEAAPASHTAALEPLEAPDETQRRARDNRRRLYHAMRSQGFTNLPSEWWHFDFGDPLWAHYGGQAEAHYGPTEPVTLESRWRRGL